MFRVVKIFTLVICGLLEQSYGCFPSRDRSSMISNVEPGELPYHVQILHDSDHVHSCGGALVIVNDTQVILTAASCLVFDDHSHEHGPEDFEVIAGVVNTSDTTFEQRRQVSRIISHANYTYPLNNIAILILEAPFDLNENVAPIDLPSGLEQTPSRGLVSGLGYPNMTDALKKVRVSTISTGICSLYSTHPITDSLICTKVVDEEFQRGTCIGDLGGPLRACTRTRSLYLAGINSVPECGTEGETTGRVYTLVAHHLDWIEEMVNNDNDSV